MERTEYFNQTKPSQLQLNNTEDSKIRQILYRDRSFGQFGVRIGFRVTVNSGDAAKIDIGPGEGYTGGFFSSENLNGSPNSGERISTITDSVTGQSSYQTTAVAQALASYSSGVKNYITLLYVETESHLLQERTYPFTQHNTIVSNTYQVSVLTLSQWNALTSDEKEQRILVAIVTAKGAGVALTSADIDQVVQPKGHPISAGNPTNITGVSINNVSDETLVGNGTLRFEAATNMLYWTAPGDTEGVGVVVPSSGTYILYSNSVSYYLEAHTIFASLPVGDQSDIIIIKSLYGREIPLASATDQVHRDMVGHGSKTINNPHALSIQDIPGGGYDHADLYHVNGISCDAESDQLRISINAANDTVEIINYGGQNNAFLIDGISYQVLTGYTVGTPGVVSFDVFPQLDSGDYLIYVDSAGNPQRVKIAGYAPADAADVTVLWDEHIGIYDMHNTSSGNGIITWDADEQTLTYQSPAAGVAGPKVRVCQLWGVATTPNGYYKLYSNSLADWIIVRLTGDLGASNSSTFSIDKNETDYADAVMLKLGVVTWNNVGEILANVRLSRQYSTADIRDEFLEEHDRYGNHTTVLRNQLRIARESHCFYAYAESGSAVRGFAKTGASAIIGEANSSYGVVGIADRVGVYGTASSTAGYFSAPGNMGVYGKVEGNYGVFGSADDTYGVAGTADTYGGSFGAVINTGVYGSADFDYGVYGTAVDNYGVYGKASNYGGYFSAAVLYGVYGKAPQYGVFGSGVNAEGVYGTAAVTGGGFKAVNTGAYGSAVANYGVYGKADVDYGVCGFAAGATGVCGQAGGDIGVYGYAAGNSAGYFRCAGDTAVVGFPEGDVGGYFRGDTVGISCSNTFEYRIVAVAPAGAIQTHVPFSVGGDPLSYWIALYTH